MNLSEDIRKKIDNRQYANLQILEHLRDYVLAHPDIRFGQMLANTRIIRYDDENNVIDPFYEESVDTFTNLNI